MTLDRHRRQRHVAHVHLEDLLAAIDVRVRHDDLAVEAARTQQRRVEHVRTVGRSDQDDAFIGLKAIHLDQQLVERLFALVIAAAKTCATMSGRRRRFRR
jgi:hypothetical protein